jgi:hypothetical protein
MALSLMAGMIVAVLPPFSGTQAAKVIYRYELDTDGVIDAGADYLIVNTSATGTAHALRFYYGGSYSRDFRDQTIEVKSDPETDVKYIDVDFTNEADIYMDACDIMLTKPGGLSSTEAAVLPSSRFSEASVSRRFSSFPS